MLEIPTEIKIEYAVARDAFEAACANPSISLAEYSAAKARYEAAMKARHAALGFG